MVIEIGPELSGAIVCASLFGFLAVFVWVMFR